MNKKIFIIIILNILLLLFGLTGGCGPSTKVSEAEDNNIDEFEIVRQAADTYMNSGKPFHITAQELYDMIRESMTGFTYDPVPYYDPMIYPGPYLIDVRSPDSEMPDLYYTGHIPGAIHIPWREIADWNNLKNLPTNRQIVVYSGTGQTGAQVTTILNVLGYDAVNLEWGITSWTGNEDCAPGRYDKARDTVWSWGGSYRAVCPLSEPTQTYSFPVVEGTDSEDKSVIIMAAANAYLKSGKEPNMSAALLHTLLYSEQNPNPGLPAGHWGGEDVYEVPFFLDIRTDESYLNGHLCGTAHFYWEDVFKEENLAILPPGGRILVTCETGHIGGVVTALLNLLGYEAINLKWGIASWSLSLPGRDVSPDRYDEAEDCIHSTALVEGYKRSNPCPG